MKCPNCGTENASGVNFCVSCGSQLPIEAVNTCPSCGTQNSPEVAFCVNCGMPLANGQQSNAPTKKSFDLNAIKEKVLPIVKNKFVLLGAGAVVLVIILISVISAIIGSDNGYIEVENAPHYYESDGKIYISSGDKLLKTTVPGKVADSGASMDGKYLYIKNDEGDLYIVNGSKVQKVASDVARVEMSVTGKGLLYTTKSEDDEGEGETELFHYVLGKKSVSVADGKIARYAISPDGKTATYTLADDDNEKTPLYFFDGNKSTKIASSKLSLCGMSNGGKYIYVTQTNDEGERTLYSYNKKGDKTKIGRIGGHAVCFNADHTQALFYYDGKTYISEKGKEVDGCAKNKELSLIMTENAYMFDSTYPAKNKELSLIMTENAYMFDSTYPVDNLYDHVYRSSDDVWFIRKNSDKSVKLVSKANYLQLDSTASYLYYVYDSEKLRMIKISDGENASEKAITIVNEMVSTYVVTSDRDFVYYVYDEELYSVNGKNGKNVKKVSNDELDDNYYSSEYYSIEYDLYISGNDTVFYSIDGDLYASSNGKKGTKVLSDGELEFVINGYVFATSEDETIWWTTNSKKFKKLITIEEE